MLEEAANFGSERITKRRSLSVRTEMSLLVLPYKSEVSVHSLRISMHA